MASRTETGNRAAATKMQVKNEGHQKPNAIDLMEQVDRDLGMIVSTLDVVIESQDIFGDSDEQMSGFLYLTCTNLKPTRECQLLAIEWALEARPLVQNSV